VKVTPLRDYICIQPEASKGVSDGGIIIPDVNREKPRQAVVVAVGRGRVTDHGKLIEPEVKVGDTVLFARYHNGQAVDATHVLDYRNKDGDGPLLIRETELLAVVEA
jgi:chaperonin GroES